MRLILFLKIFVFGFFSVVFAVGLGVLAALHTFFHIGVRYGEKESNTEG